MTKNEGGLVKDQTFSGFFFATFPYLNGAITKDGCQYRCGIKSKQGQHDGQNSCNQDYRQIILSSLQLISSI